MRKGVRRYLAGGLLMLVLCSLASGIPLVVRVSPLWAAFGTRPVEFGVDSRGEFYSGFAGQPFDFHTEVLGLAIGVPIGPVQVAAGFKVLEGSVDWINGPLERGAFFPLYLYVLPNYRNNQRSRLSPVPHAYVGGFFWESYVNYVSVGAGVSWTFWAVNPGFELNWRHQNFYRDVWNDQISLRATLGFGGWYDLFLDETADTESEWRGVRP